MEKLKLSKSKLITFKEGCERYLEDCRLRNLREGTIGHYKQSYVQFYKWFDPNMYINNFNEKMYNDYILYLKSYISNDRSIRAYLRDLISTAHYWMNNEWILPFKMRCIKCDNSHIETYTDEELELLLKKPDLKNCGFSEYQNWVIVSFLFSTGVRCRSLINIKVNDLDFDNSVVYINVTKNRKQLIIPLNQTLERILKEYITVRPYKRENDYLFTNIFGEQYCRSTLYEGLYQYNKKRGVETTGIHRYRHTFSKQWILNGGNVVSLSKILGHSSLTITQNYINLLVSDLNKEVNNINILDKFQNTIKKKIKIF